MADRVRRRRNACRDHTAAVAGAARAGSVRRAARPAGDERRDRRGRVRSIDGRARRAVRADGPPAAGGFPRRRVRRQRGAHGSGERATRCVARIVRRHRRGDPGSARRVEAVLGRVARSQRGRRGRRRRAARGDDRR